VRWMTATTSPRDRALRCRGRSTTPSPCLQGGTAHHVDSISAHTCTTACTAATLTLRVQQVRSVRWPRPCGLAEVEGANGAHARLVPRPSSSRRSHRRARDVGCRPTRRAALDVQRRWSRRRCSASTPVHTTRTTSRQRLQRTRGASRQRLRRVDVREALGVQARVQAVGGNTRKRKRLRVTASRGNVTVTHTRTLTAKSGLDIAARAVGRLFGSHCSSS
jgi:hypothetical protein